MQSRNKRRIEREGEKDGEVGPKEKKKKERETEEKEVKNKRYIFINYYFKLMLIISCYCIL